MPLPPHSLIAPTANPPVLANVVASTLLAHTALPPMLADAGSSTCLALSALPPVLADDGSSTPLARVAAPPVLADAAAPTVIRLALMYCAVAHAHIAPVDLAADSSPHRASLQLSLLPPALTPAHGRWLRRPFPVARCMPVCRASHPDCQVLEHQLPALGSCATFAFGHVPPATFGCCTSSFFSFQELTLFSYP